MNPIELMTNGYKLMSFNPNNNCSISQNMLHDKNTIRKVQECGVILFNKNIQYPKQFI